MFRTRAEQDGLDDEVVTSYASDAYDAMWSIALALDQATQTPNDGNLNSSVLPNFSYL